MKISQIGKDLIIHFEGEKLTAYLCSAGVPTIGIGSTFYEDGSKVKLGDKITKERSRKLFDAIADKFSSQVFKELKKPVKQQQFDALVSFAFNVGMGNFRKSTLLKKVNANPNDATIRNEFLKWNKAGGKVLNGLTKRREAEAKLYFYN